MKLKRLNILALVGIIHILLVIAPRQGEAVTRINGNFSLGTTFASGETQPSVFSGGVNLEIIPPTRKFQVRLTVPLTFSVTTEGGSTTVSPIGNGIWGADISGERYNLNLQYGRLATVSNAAQLLDTTLSRAALAVFLTPGAPTFYTNLSRTETTVAGISSQTDNFSVSSDYNYKWMNFRGSLSRTETSGSSLTPATSYNLGLGMGGSYNILPRTTLTGNYDFNRYTADASSDSTTHTMSLRVDVLPFDWLSVGGIITRTINDVDLSASDIQQSAAVSVGMSLPGRVKITPSAGTRTFADVGAKRTVNFAAIEASFSDYLRENIKTELRAARSYESDPSQGQNISDSAAVNLITDITPRIALTASLNMTRNDNEAFVSSQRFDGSGTLTERDALDQIRGGLPAGFIFFDTVNNDIYTKNSATIGDWSLPVHFVPETLQYNFSKTVQMRIIPTDKTTAIINYTSSSTAESFDIVKLGSHSFNGSLTYTPNRRTNFSLSGVALIPEVAVASYSATATMTYRYLPGQQINLGYSWQSLQTATHNSLTGGIGFNLRKRTSLGIQYTLSRLFEKEQAYLVRVSLNKSF
ncbi:MAG: hypothetical protein NDI77_03575 [Geobacteraceae bacterium]|nr:hypothetical protein [Geobacteraceae bacterium]